jgi:hypothetical protein
MEQADKGQLSAALQNKIGSKPVVKLQVLVNGEPIKWKNNKAPVTVTIPYSATEAEKANPEHVVVWYIAGDGKVTRIPSGKYDEATSTVTFTTSHFSQYAVSYEVKSFEDLGGFTWAKKPIEVLASKGIIDGLSDRRFAPEQSITRADFILLLVRALDLQTDETAEPFADVAANAYYYEALSAARALGIAQGAGDNRFNPHASITREDMIVLTAKALEAAGKLTLAGSDQGLEGFEDAGEVADYAKASMSALVSKGLIQGSHNRLLPKTSTLRSQAAVLLYRIYNLPNH